MSFASVQYALFLPLVVVAHWLLPRRARMPLLLVASYAFYGWWSPRFCLLLAATTTVDWAVGRAMAGQPDRRRRGQLLAVSLVANFGVLGYFKYAGFFVEEASALFVRLGWREDPVVLSILLPVGVSFFTFQSVAYVIDVYRRHLEPVASWVDYATFVAFFPQLVAGPISRAASLVPQLRADRRPPGRSAVATSLGLLLRGLVKKVVIADSLATLTGPAFGGDPDAGTLTAVVGILAFTGQIYADFSAYTDLARGSSRLFSVELVHNFRQPYLSRSVTEFWRRWHITLSSWLRDYLYVPLGGNRRSRRRTMVNLLVTMVLGGLWHGASWTFVCWGAVHGALLAAERAFGVASTDDDRLPAWREAPRVAATFTVVAMAWVLFRAASIDEAFGVVAALGRRSGASPSAGDALLLAACVGALVAGDVLERRVRDPLAAMRGHPVIAGSVVGAALGALVVFSGATPTPFLYFQF